MIIIFLNVPICYDNSLGASEVMLGGISNHARCISLYVRFMFEKPTAPYRNNVATLHSMARVEVPCAVAIRTAQSVIEEVPEAGSSSIRAISQCNSRNPERSVHNMTKKFNLRLPIPLTDVQLGEENYPILRMTDWARFLLSMNLWHSLCGLEQPNDERCC